MTRHPAGHLAPVTDTPIAGLYRGRMVRGGPWVAVRIWFGPPADPVTGEPLDRSHRWQALRNGESCEVDTVWPYVYGQTCDEGTYETLLQSGRWAAENNPAWLTTPVVPEGEVNMDTRFDWECAAAVWLNARRKHDIDQINRATWELKTIAPLEAKRAYGHGVEVTRAKNGAATVKEIDDAE